MTVGLVGAVVLLVAVSRDASVTRPELPRAVRASVAAPVAPTTDAEVEQSTVPRSAASSRLAGQSRRTAWQHLGFVLVADPAFDAAAATVVRLRMPRSTLVSLGVPIPDPDAAGEVDIELLVGEDGVARSIRRARAVARYETQE